MSATRLLAVLTGALVAACQPSPERATFKPPIDETSLARSPIAAVPGAVGGDGTLRLANEEPFRFGIPSVATAVDGATRRFGFAGGEQWWTLRSDGRLQHTLRLDDVGEALSIEVPLVGGRVELRAGARSARIHTAAGLLLRYDDLRAWDGTGRPLPATLEPAPNGLRIAVDTRGAEAPVWVDPILSAVTFAPEGGQQEAHFGTAAAAGDFNGDGRGDLAIGAPGHSQSVAAEGCVHIFLGGATGIPATASFLRCGGVTGAGAGSSLAAIDLDGDDRSDLVVGAPSFGNGEAEEGRVSIYLTGGSTLPSVATLQWEGGVAGGHFGAAVAGVGDVDGDGTGDILVGAPDVNAAGTGRGSVALHLGSPSGPNSTAAATWVGEDGEHLGDVLSGLFDTNGDGHDDFAFGSPRWSSNTGRVRLYLGGSPLPGAVADFEIQGSAAGARLGASIAQLGDVDGDTYADLLVAEPGWSDGSMAVGRVRLHGGSISGPQAALAWSWSETGDGALTGEGLTGLGDLNGDGYADFAVGSPGWQSWALETLGHVSAFFGSATGPGGGHLGIAGDTWAPIGGILAAAGDTTGDGTAELLVLRPLWSGGQNDEGLVERYDGDVGLSGYGYQHIAGGGQDGAYYGSSVAIVGDLDGDGYDEIAGGAPGWDGGQTDEGAVFVRFGHESTISAMPDWSWEANQGQAHLGAALSGGLDTNGDGYDDLVVAAPDWDTGDVDAGRVWLHYGGPTGPDAAADWEGSGVAPGDRVGHSVAMGDWNGDGYGDIASGLPDTDEIGGLTDVGAVVIVFGSSTGILEEPYNFVYSSPPVANVRWGAAVANAGDVDGDGFDDLLVGAPGDDTGGTDAGGAHIIPGGPYGPDWTPSWSIWSSVPGQQLGWSAASAGDSNGDGFADVVLGAPFDDAGGTDAGWVGLWFGSPTGLPQQPDQQRSGVITGGQLGYAASGIGDLDADGLSEIGVGAPGEDHDGNTDDGTIYVFRAYPGAGLADPPIYDEWGFSPNARAGAALSGGGDVDGDGFGDFLAGTPTYSGSFAEHGNVRLFGGNRADGVNAAFPFELDAVDPNTGGRIGTMGEAPLSGFEVQALLRAPLGRTQVRLKAEIETEGQPFDGLGALHSPWTDSLFSGASGAVPSGALSPQQGYIVRAAVQVSPSTGAPLLRGPWHYLGRSGHAYSGHLRTAPLDTDGDGQRDDTDCAPLDPDFYIFAPDVPDDGLDQDCDGIGAYSCFRDLDGDDVGGAFYGYAEGVTCVESFGEPNLVDVGGDCDDGDAGILGGSPEACNGLDDDCDGILPGDEGIDADEDGIALCADCDDGNVLVRPDFPIELCDGADNDCDVSTEAEGGELDADGDGFRGCGGDCDDADPAAYPGALELAVDIDQNCDGVVGQGDLDGDGESAAEGDCDDTDATIRPGATEVCDGRDNTCDGALLAGERDDPDGDGALACADCWEGRADISPLAAEVCDGEDTDCDGFFGPGEADLDADGALACGGDCADSDALISPNRAEDCTNGIDDDCSGAADDDRDADGDGFRTCSGDCGDLDEAVFPGAAEVCNGRDDDCDTLVDDGFDADGDGVLSCAGDCDDTDATVFLDAPADCEDEQDNDCRPTTVETLDSDGDGYVACPEDGEQPDCWEGNASVFPGAVETCDHVDGNCDGEIDEGFDADADSWPRCGGDCEDTDGLINPSAQEVCGDDVDQDCDRVELACAEDRPELDLFVPLGCNCESGGRTAPLGAAAVFAAWFASRRRRRLSPT